MMTSFRSFTLGKGNRPFTKPDASLIQEFKEGDPTAFQKLYDRYKKPVLKIIAIRVKNHDTAEELLQEVFLRVYRYREQYNPEYEFSTWLWTITKNIVSDHLNTTQSDPLATKTNPEGDIEIQEVACNQATAEIALLKQTERKNLFRMLIQLPKLQRKAILLRVIKGLSYHEIAHSMKLSLSSVKSLIHRGKISMQSLTRRRTQPIQSPSNT